jgi:CHAT domain-containing protein/Tfp pilus assembly protein PilF
MTRLILPALLVACCLFAPVASGNPMDIQALLDQALDMNQSGHPGEAEPLARQAITLAEALGPRFADKREKLLSIAQQRLGISLRQQGRHVEAEPVLRDALRGAEQSKGYSSRLAIKTQIHLGLSLLSQGRYAEADKQLREAVRRTPTPSDDDTLDAWLDARARLGKLQVLAGNYGEAESLLTTVLEKSAAARSQGAQRWRHHANLFMAILRLRQGHPDQAEAYARASAEIAPTAWGPEHGVTAEAYDQLGQVLLKLDRLDEAETWLHRATAIAEPLLGQDFGASPKPFRDLAKLLEKRERYDEAEALYAKASAAAEKNASSTVLSQTLRAHGRFLLHSGRPEEAQPLYDRAVKQADRLFALSRGLEDAARENMLATLRPIYSEAIASRVKLDTKQPGQGHDRLALVDVARTQSRLFTELLRAADVARQAGDDAFIKLKARRDAALARQIELRRRFTLTARLDAAGKEILPIQPIRDPFILARWRSSAEDLRHKIEATEQERSDAEARLWQQFPRYMELEEPRPVSVDDLQRRWLLPDETLLAYYRLPHQLLVFLVSRDEFRLERVAVDLDEIDRLVARARKPLESGGRPDLLAQLEPEVLNRLYELLLQPVASRMPAGRHLLVVGDGPLYTLPYEMLVTRWGESDRKAFAAARGKDLSEYGKLAYAGAQWRFSYLPSLATLAIQRAEQKKQPAFAQSLIAYADPVFERADATPGATTRALLADLGATRGGRVNIPRLPETAEEVQAVADILGGQHDIYLRDAAQETQVKHSDLAQARYLHFATHGLLGGEFSMLKGYAVENGEPGRGGTRSLVVVDDEETTPAAAPVKGQPALVLSLVGDLGGEDGLLTMGEVMGLKMNAELVVLSACNTAGEKVESRNGEGFAGLTRAFMYAGARGLLVSHWSVESLATRDLITDFFRRHKAGTATPEALAAAQAGLRGSRDQRLGISRAHPFFWAPFVHVGD